MNLFHSLAPKLAVAVASLAVLLALACGDPTPTPTAVPTATTAPTATPVPTPTPQQPTATPAPTVTPEPTADTGMSMGPGRSLLPEGSTLIVDGRPAAIFASPLMMPVLEAMFGDSESGMGIADEFEAQTGIDLRSVPYIELFMDLNVLLTMGMGGMGMGEDTERGMALGMRMDEPPIGAALHGAFDEAEVISSFKRDPDVEFEVDVYRGYNVYTFLYEADVYTFLYEAGGGLSVAFIGSEVFLIGTTSGVEAMLDVQDEAILPVSGEMKKAFDALGDRDIGMAIALPPELLEMAAGGEDAMPQLGMLSGFNLGAIAAQVSTIKLLLRDDALEIEGHQIFQDDTAAAAAKEYSEGIVAMLGTMASTPESKELIGGIGVSQSGTAVTLSMTIDATMLETILALLFPVMDMMPTAPQS